MHGDGRATRHDASCLGDLDRELVGTCAFVAAYLQGVSADCLWEDGRDRGFLVFGRDVGEPRVWDPLRHSFLYVDARGDGWRLYDFTTARHFQVQKVGEMLTFADEIAPSLAVQVRVGSHYIRASGPGGERRFRIRAQGSTATSGDRPTTPPGHVDPVEIEALPDPVFDLMQPLLMT